MTGWSLVCRLLPAGFARGAFRLGLGNIDTQWASFEVLAVEHFDGFLGFFSCRHLDEAETAAAAGFAIGNNRSGNDLASGREVVAKSIAIGAVGKISYVQCLVHSCELCC